MWTRRKCSQTHNARVKEATTVIQILDPSREAAPAGSQKAQRIASLSGKNVAFISNGKKAPVASSNI